MIISSHSWGEHRVTVRVRVGLGIGLGLGEPNRLVGDYLVACSGRTQILEFLEELENLEIGFRSRLGLRTYWTNVRVNVRVWR